MFKACGIVTAMALGFSAQAMGAARVIDVTYRDFAGTGTTSTISNRTLTHPDFEFAKAYVWNVVNQAPAFVGGRGIGVIPDLGIVQSTLGPDKKPVYSLSASGETTNGASDFGKWYNDDPNYSLNVPGQITLADQGDGTFVFDTNRFFPIDGMGFGNTVREKNKLPTASPPLAFPANVDVSTEAHNWHFTMEMHTQFTFLGNEQFTYRGDDDLWVYIGGKLVIDLGGVHNPLQRTISLSNLNDVDGVPLALEVGGNYDFDLFFAERHRNESNFRVETSILIGEEVPEPATLSLLALSAGAMMLRRKR